MKIWYVKQKLNYTKIRSGKNLTKKMFIDQTYFFGITFVGVILINI